LVICLHIGFPSIRHVHHPYVAVDTSKTSGCYNSRIIILLHLQCWKSFICISVWKNHLIDRGSRTVNFLWETDYSNSYSLCIRYCVKWRWTQQQCWS